MAANKVDLIPDTWDINAYAGNTITFTVTAAAGLIDNFLWDGQLRLTRDASTVDAVFDITPPATPGAPATVMLKAADTSRLAGSSAAVMKRARVGTRSVEMKVYTGEYDVQVRHPTNPDPVHTVVQGTITLNLDVTRVP